MPKGAVTKLTNLEVLPSPPQHRQPTRLCQLRYADPIELYLRDGEVVIFRRPNSPLAMSF
jgi:integrase